MVNLLWRTWTDATFFGFGKSAAKEDEWTMYTALRYLLVHPMNRCFLSMNHQAELPNQLSENLVQLARLGLGGRSQDVQAYLRQLIRRLRSAEPDLAHRLSEILARAPTALSPLRDLGSAIVPIDADSRLSLVRSEYPVLVPDAPILSGDLNAKLEQVVAERSHLAALEAKGLGPTRSLLFVGPPGVGKTLSARWLAYLLDRPLITLDLAAVMSSYLGKTGSNIRAVLDYAKGVESVLLLDEFDAIAKRRDDEGDIGELKRLVTVLLQEVDDWPATSLLIAATNHGDLLDPAVWRRFDDVLEFKLPPTEQREQALRALFGEDADVVAEWLPVLAQLWDNRSFSDLTRTIQWIRRRATTRAVGVAEVMLDQIGAELRARPPEMRKRAAGLLAKAGYSDRRISELVGISRDTIRRTRTGADDG